MNIYTPHETGNVAASSLPHLFFSKTGQLLNMVPKPKNKLERHDRLSLFTLHILPLPIFSVVLNGGLKKALCGPLLSNGGEGHSQKQLF